MTALSTATASPATVRRPELEGLRTVAALLVLVYHVWFGRVSGGVDVFFVVTGFFITMMLLKQVTAGRIMPLAFFGRLIRRLLPSAAAVLVAVGLITLLLAPRTLQRRGFEEIIASNLSLENLYLAFNSIDYLNADDPSTGVQHFWAMSLQAQFYVLWLLLAALALAIVRWRGTRPVQTMLGILMAVFTVSLALSVWQTATAQPFAYFVPWTRMWEFAIGGFTALLGAQVQLRGAAAGAASWSGLIALLATGAVLPVATGFPGVIAAVPALAAALILMSTRSDERWWSATRILSWRPLVWLGSIAFGIYLWHWPLLTAYRYWRGLDAVPGWRAGAVILIGSIVLAYLTKRLLETPVRSGWQAGGWRRKTVASALVVAWLAALVTPISWLGVQWHRQHEIAAYEPPTEEIAACWGYGELRTGIDACADVLEHEPMVPDRDATAGDHRWSYDCVNRFADKTLVSCEFGPDDADVRVALMGNSHAAVLIPDFAALAEQRGWQLTTLVGQNCIWLATDPNADCGSRWQEQEELLLGGEPFDAVIALGSAAQGSTPDPSPTVARQLPRLLEVGTEVIVLQDNPRMSWAEQTCLFEARDASLRSGDCDTTVETGYDYTDPFWEVSERFEGVVRVPTQDFYCVDGICPLVIGNVIAYGDRHHITATYAVTMFDDLVLRIDEASEVLAR